MKHFSLTDHAIARYHERVRPGLSLDSAGLDLRQRVSEAPEIVTDAAGYQEVDLGGGVVVVVYRRRARSDHWVVVTCRADEGRAAAMRDALERAGLVA